MRSCRTALTAIALALGLGAFNPSAQPQVQPTQRIYGFEALQSWLRVVRRHTIGAVDDAARDAVKMPPIEQQQVIADLQLVRLLVLQAGRQGTVQNSGGTSNSKTPSADLRGKRLTLDQLAPLLGLTDQETGGPMTASAIADAGSQARLAIAQLMIRAALLHSDVAMAPPSELPPPKPTGPRLAQTAVQLNDGRETAVLSVSIHFAIGRESIALVMPSIGGGAVARQWYLTTLAFLQGTRNYDALFPHLDTARIALANDARVWLWSGAAQENAAAPPQQVGAGVTNGKIDSPTLLLARAEAFYRRALELDAACAECSLRLARVRQLSGQMEEAATLIARAEPKLTNPVLRYYAALFAGRSAEALNKITEARAAFERAMSLFPRAQSPRLALADLAFRDSESSQALTGVRTMFVTADRSNSGDPWWYYDVSLVMNWRELVADLRRNAIVLAEAK